MPMLLRKLVYNHHHVWQVDSPVRGISFSIDSNKKAHNGSLCHCRYYHYSSFQRLPLSRKWPWKRIFSSRHSSATCTSHPQAMRSSESVPGTSCKLSDKGGIRQV